MKAQVKAAYITGICGIIATILAAVIGHNLGKTSGNKETLSQIGVGVANVNGDNANIVINDTNDVIDNYEKMKSENDSLLTMSSQYSKQLEEAETELEALRQQVGDAPILTFSNLALCINGEDIPVNKNNAMVIIDGREYISKEVVENVIGEGQNMVFKNDTLFLGKVVHERANLFEQWNVNMSQCDMEDTITDSYGRIHANGLCFRSTSKGDAIYNVEEKFSLLTISLAIKEDAGMDRVGVVRVKADETVVYTSPNICKTTEPFTILDIPIDNCNLLTIEYTGDYNNRCIVYDAFVYN